MKSATDDFPKAFGEGMLFAFSGLDGHTDYDTQVVGTTIDPALGLGMTLHLPDKMALFIETAFHWTKHEVEVALNDVLVFQAAGHQLAFFAFSSDTIAGYSAKPFGVELFVQQAGEGMEKVSDTPEETYYRSRSILKGSAKENRYCHYVLVRRTEGVRISFGFSWSYSGEPGAGGYQEARKKAAAAAQAPLERKIEARLAGYRKFIRTDLPPDIRDTYLKSVSVLKSSIHSPNQVSPYYWVTPDREPHRMMWIWDSVFQLTAIVKLWPDKAPDLINSVFHYQQDDGFIPHMMSPHYLGPHTQPPLLGWGAWMAYEAVGDKDFLARAYHRNRQFLKWIIKNRTNQCGMLGFCSNLHRSWCYGGESGLDNSPRFERYEKLDCVDLCAYVVKEIDYLRKMEIKLGLPEDREFTEYRERLCRFITEKLWDEKDGIFYDRDPVSGVLTGVPACSAFTPLWAETATPEQAARLAEHLENPEEFATRMPLPSVARNHPCCNKDYWRGGTWLNFVYLACEGLDNYGMTEKSNEIRRKAVSDIVKWHSQTGCLYEYYDPDSELSPVCLPKRVKQVTGYGSKTFQGAIRNYGWTASTFIGMVDKLFTNVRQ